MLEFIFFHKVPYQLFIDYLIENKFKPATKQEEESYTILIPEEMDDDLYNAIEEKYDILFDMNAELMNDEAGVHMASITVTLQDGRLSYADVDPKVLGRVIGAITSEELSEIVNSIVKAVENPQEKTICQRNAKT